jgi:7-alpha-hydroxysteroid dehydrogenase
MTDLTAPLDRFRLDGKVAIVTGAGKGIGAAIALVLAGAGADVAIAARSKDDLDGVAADIERIGRRVHVQPTDVMDHGAIAALVDTTVHALGGIDIVVNNAGGSNAKRFLDTTAEDLEWCFRFNVTSAFELSRLAVPHILERGGGSILNLSSVTGHEVKRGTLSYGTAKAAVTQMTRLMAADLAPRIRVNAIAPGAIETPSLRDFLAKLDPVNRQRMLDKTPMRRNGRVEDIADAALYLVSPAASWVSGKLLDIDGMAAPDFLDKGIPDL